MWMRALRVVTLKNRGMWGEARFGGTCGVEVGLPAREEMRILYVKSYKRAGPAASGDISIFLDWWDPLCPLK